MLLWWRAWYHRNDIIFEEGKASVGNSFGFLHNYYTTLQGIARGTAKADRKGKAPATAEVVKNTSLAKGSVDPQTRWEKPSEDWVKCNVDASFLAGSNTAS